MCIRTLLLACLAILLAGCQPSESQPAQSGADSLSTERIIENLRLQIPQLRRANSIDLGALSSSSVPGFQRSTLTINGANRVPVLIRDDGEQLLVLAGEPVDVSKSASEAQAAIQAEAEEKQAALAKITETLPSRGPDDAPVTMTVFSDFQCPYCAKSLPLIEQVREKYPETVRYVFAHYPLPMHGWARPASIAAECAARQSEDAFWALHDAYFANQGQITEQNVLDKSATYLGDTGVDMDRWRTCAREEESTAHQNAAKAVDQAMQTGQNVQVRGTPTFFINGEMYQGQRSLSAISQRIETARSGG
jgi:protein-disulfide isomerase